MLDRLEALAREATPGPWFASDWWQDDGPDLTTIEAHEPEGPLALGQSSIWPGGIRCINVAETKNGDRPLPDAAYIAAANPAAVLKLIAVVKAAQSQVDAYDAITKNRGIEWPGAAVKEHEAAEEALRQALSELGRE